MTKISQKFRTFEVRTLILGRKCSDEFFGRKNNKITSWLFIEPITKFGQRVGRTKDLLKNIL